MYPDRCPLCSSDAPRADAPCPRCGYHADSYNRALDDVALSFRLSMSDRSRTKPAGQHWYSAIPTWCRAPWGPR